MDSPGTDYEIRFGIAELVCIVILIGVHLTVMRSFLGKLDFEDLPRLICGILAPSIVFPLASAYLIMRYATTNKIQSARRRIALIIGLEFALSLGVFMLPVVVFFFRQTQ